MNRKWLAVTALLFGGLLASCWMKGQSRMEKPEEGFGFQEAETVGGIAKEEGETLKIALTFDDGPSPAYTGLLLDGLQEKGVRASFFLIGKSAEQYPNLVKRMAQEGHLIGNHTYSHVQLSACSYQEAVAEIQKENEVLFTLTGRVPVYIRPPFGSYTKKLEEKLPMEKVLWTIDPEDWKVQNTASVVKHVLSHVEDGGIILLHDQYPSSVEAALQIVDILQRENWEFVTVDELAGEYEVH